MKEGTSRRLRVVICGGGVAGLSLALSLQRRGHAPVVIERSRGLRSDGYMLDFFGPGYSAAEQMGILTDLGRIHYPISRLAFVDPDGHERFAVSYPTLRRLVNGRHFNFMRGDLERVLHDHVAKHVPIHYGLTVESFAQSRDGVSVTLSDGSVETADLLVGADGVRSRVRSLAFGGDDAFVRRLGFNAIAYVIDDRRLAQGIDDAFYTLTLPGRQVSLYPLRDGRLATLFVHEAPAAAAAMAAEAVEAELHTVYGDLGWIVPRLLGGVGPAPYHDAVTQVVMPKWSDGRVVLLGDACGCISLLAGQGAALAMAGASVLAEELTTATDIATAIARYEHRLMASVAKKQRAGRGLAHYFVPSGRVRLALREAVMRMAGTPMAAWLLKRRISVEEIPTMAH